MRKFEGFMKGVNLGGWLSQCTITDEHLNSFICEADVKKIADMGADHLRLPIDYSVIESEDGSDKPDGYKHIDNCFERKIRLAELPVAVGI